MIGGAKGIGIGIDFGIPNQYCRATSKPYIEKDVLDSLRVVTSAYGKSNNDADRSIVKNLVDPDNPFVISNAAFKLNSGFGEYKEDFTTWSKVAGTSIITDSKYVLTDEKAITNGGYFLWNRLAKDSFKVKISNIPNGGWMSYRYKVTEDTQVSSLFIREDGIYTLPATIADSDVDFFISTASAPAKDWVGLTITQIPSFEGAFFTDGIDDLITSTKTVQEMGITDEVTVVSMIHQIDKPSNFITTNNIRTSGSVVGRNAISLTDKTGIYGWYKDNIQGSTINVINNILGDKADYTASASSNTNLSSKFSVVGYISNDSIIETSQVAWYWTIIANKVLTTDQINQVIAYFNLDRTLKPDILCNTIKQGITNENHAEFGDRLIDFSGNGRDIQLNNIAWKGDSGIGKYEVDFASLNYNNTTSVFTATYKSCSISKIIKDGAGNIFYNWGQHLAAINSTKIQVIGLDEIGAILEFTYLDESGNSTTKQYSTDGIYDLPASAAYQGDSHNTNFRFSIRGYIGDCDITITQIPSHAGALCLDGINDFGKVINMPIYKDYTIIIDYIRTKININTESCSDACVLSKSKSQGVGAFMFNLISGNREDVSYSFGHRNIVNIDDTIRAIYYQSKYINNGQNIDIESTVVDSDKLWLGTFRDNDSRFLNGAIYFLMSFPYSMSEFLIERQLKKHKLGTLYPDMVEFRPVIKSSVEYASISYLLIIPGQGTVTPVIGQYYPILSTDTSLVVYVATNGVDEVANLTINGQEPTSSSIHVDGRFKFEFPFNNSPQKINITIDEYIRYEDIKQPYPSIINLVSIDKTHFYTYGDKLKVGDVILYNSYKNLLKGLYSLNGQLKYNDVYIYDIDGRITVAKEMVFSWTVSPTWLFDNNEPKCILSPRLLRIPNSSYKILGHIPDISGHGNHGVIHNSAYAGASGANGYKQDFTSWKTNGSGYSIVTDSKYILTNEKAITNGGYFLWNRLAKDSFKVKISNIPNGGWMSYRYKVTEDTQVSSLFIREDGIYTLPATIADSEVDFFISTVSAPAEDWIGLTIEQIGEYDGAYCLDGVDDFVTIPTTIGGKQVLMKVNWQSIAGTAILYDQRTNGGFAIFNRDFDTNENKVPAYRARNIGGSTYIDGILNEYIYASELKDITHNIVELCDPELNTGTLNPKIGSSYLNSNYTQMSLYDFMLFDEISTDDKIQELNKYVGIEAKVELPPYYWDTYGKTNSDADRDTIQQRGVAVGDYDLINYNHAYEGMSGYNGYPVVFGESKTWEAQGTKDGDKYYIYTSNANKFNITQIKISSSLFYTYIKRNGELTSGNKDIPSFNLKVTGLDYDKFYLAYYYLKSADVEVRNIINITSDGIYELPKSFASDGSLTETNSYIGLSFTRKSSEIPDIIQNVNVTIEVLPEYENGLVYDGVEDYSKNVNIPALTEYTYIYKRTIINVPTNATTLLKGADKTNGGAFIADYGNKWQFNFGQYNIIQGIADGINWQTVNSFNGTSINKGENTDDSGITVAKFSNGYTSMVFYKLILYPKTISLLEINFLKNLMEKDEIIDLNNPIFIQ